MKNLSRRTALKTAVGAVALSTLVYTDLIAKNKSEKHDNYLNPNGLTVLNNDNYPVLAVNDTLHIDDRVANYEGEGWYIWNGKVWQVCLTPNQPGFLCAYQISGEMRDVAFEDFKPSGQVTASMRSV